MDGVLNTGFAGWLPADWALSDGLGEVPKQYPQPAGTRPGNLAPETPRGKSGLQL